MGSNVDVPYFPGFEYPFSGFQARLTHARQKQSGTPRLANPWDVVQLKQCRKGGYCMRLCFVRLLGLPIIFMLLVSCAATSLVDSWRNPSLSNRRYHKVLVVSVSRDENTRRVFEDVVSAELGQRGITAVPGYTLIAKEEKANKEVMERAVAASGAEAVLTIQTIKVEQQAGYQPGYVENYPNFWYPPAFPAWNLYGYYGSSTYYEPPTSYMYEVATIQANLFDVASGKLSWAATLQSSEPGNVTSVSKDLARLVIEKLIKEGLI
jgi:hypothetical protein